MTLPDFLTQHPYGEIRLTGHRIGLLHVVQYYNEGFSPEMLLEQFPTLPLSLIHKVIAFYLDNRAEVDAYVAKCEAELDQQRAAAPKGPSLAELRRRLESLHPVEKA
jgi:uncharacterized protein (DUF433 family)